MFIVPNLLPNHKLKMLLLEIKLQKMSCNNKMCKICGEQIKKCSPNKFLSPTNK